MRDENGRRLLGEIASVHVSCDDCGHSRLIKPMALREVQNLGVHTFGDLCRRICCGECPRQPVDERNLTIRPTWRCEIAA